MSRFREQPRAADRNNCIAEAGVYPPFVQTMDRFGGHPGCLWIVLLFVGIKTTFININFAELTKAGLFRKVDSSQPIVTV